MVIFMFFHHIERAKFRLVLRNVTDYKWETDVQRQVRVVNTSYSKFCIVSK